MRKIAQILLSGGTVAALAFGVTTLATPAPAEAQFISCGVCAGPFTNDAGQICFLMSCNGGPCNIEFCLDF